MANRAPMRFVGGGLDLVKDACIQEHEHFRSLMALDPSSVEKKSTSQHKLFHSDLLSSRAEHISAAEESETEASAPTSALGVVITLPELTLGCHEGRVLYGWLCVIPFRISSVFTVLEEDETGMGVRVIIYNDLLSTASSRDMEARFSVGTRVAIKNPYFKICADGKTAVRVDCPADIIVLNTSFDIKNDSEYDRSPPAKALDYLCITEIEDIRCEGNRLLSVRDWAGAVNKYSQCIDHALRKTEVYTKTNNVTESEQCDRIVMLAYSSRAKARMGLKLYMDALRDADEALLFNPTHIKTLLYKGKAAYGLGLYKDSYEILKAAHEQCLALKQAPHQPSILKSLESSRAAYKQSETGDIDLTDYYELGDVPFCPDFVGPVEIHRVQYGSGRRGLFATQGFEKDVNVLVSNPFAVGLYGGDLITSLSQRLTVASKREIAQLYSLQLHALQQEMDIPSMELFRPGSTWFPSNEGKLQVDIGFLREIVRFNAFGSKSHGLINLTGKFSDSCRDSEFCEIKKDISDGIWIIPSFLNHSCTPNCVTELAGDVMFVRGARDIKEGEELTISYIKNLSRDVDARQTALRKWFFTCTCERCLFEETMKPQLSKLCTAYASLVPLELSFLMATGAVDRNYCRWLRTRVSTKLATLAGEVEEVIFSLYFQIESKKHDWIRAMFHETYIAKYDLAMKNKDEASSTLALKIVLNTLNSLSDPVAAEAFARFNSKAINREKWALDLHPNDELDDDFSEEI